MPEILRQVIEFKVAWATTYNYASSDDSALFFLGHSPDLWSCAPTISRTLNKPVSFVLTPLPIKGTRPKCPLNVKLTHPSEESFWFKIFLSTLLLSSGRGFERGRRDIRARLPQVTKITGDEGSRPR